MLHLKRKFWYQIAAGCCLFMAAVMASCSKEDTTNASPSNVQLLVANMSPDLFPVNLYIDGIRQTTTGYSYNSTPAYAALNTTNKPLQIRSMRVPGTSGEILFTITDTLRSNTKYSIFVTGLFADSIYHVFLADDTAALAPIGKGGKLRFVNASPTTTAFDVWANGTPVLKAVKFNTVSPYVILPAGSYTFKAYAAGNSTTELANVQGVTIRDGGLYTMYSKGILNRATTDTARLSLAYITNK